MNCSDIAVAALPSHANTSPNACLELNIRAVNGSDEGIYDVPAAVVALLSLCYGSISVLAVVGNALVMWIVATSRRMQNVTNCFIANLALADIVIGLFAIPFQFQAALLQRWNLPHFMCAFCPFVQVLSVNVSIFTLTAIAVDRHRAILNPLSARPTKLRARLSIAAIWCLSAALAAPMAAALRVTIVTEKIGEQWVSKPFCVNVHLSNKAMMSYRMVLFLVQYLIPLCVITYVYSRMALRLWGSKAPGNAQDLRDATLMKNKKRVIKMLVIVVALFALCWLPLQTYNVLQDVFPYINEYHYINIIFFCCDWLAMSNSCYNPFIYGIYNEKFKREFRQRFPWKKSACSASPVTETEDLDGCGGGSGGGGGGGGGALCSTRSSLRVPNCTPGGYDWRRAYSAAPVRQQPSASQHDAVSGLLRGSASRRVACPVGGGGGGGGAGGCCEQAGQPQNGHLAGRDTELFVFGGARSRHHHRHHLFGSREELCSL
ncbi:prolactin-releasing peptide receptor-like isoform X1 [Schistocerca americana]|uniref:prolactin-releasing peptide receptor-like isoform X1 n=1 Tax=Schistocerca americana TaxID=7009 RepID=UPI001F4FDD04|nr:prolactin-releasing peptide receptor-like isoform X1 [Schistocerca americana]